MKSVYRVAIIGLGRMGSTIDDEQPDSPPISVASACKASDRLEVVAGADIDAGKRQAFKERWGVEAVYDDYLAMIEQEKPDIVAICTKGVLHAEMSVKVAEAGVNMIYCEKAIACSMAEADAVLKAVGGRGVYYNTGVLRRFNTRYHQARKLIEQGKIGEVKTAVHYASSSVMHGHIHSIDTLSYLLGDPKIESVWGELIPRDLAIENNRTDKDPQGVYHLIFENGIEAVTVPAGTWEFEVLGSTGSIRVLNNGLGILLREAGGEKKRNWQEVPVTQLPRESATKFCLEDLTYALEQKRPSMGNIQVTHHTTEACIAVVESHMQKRRVTLPIENRDLYVFHV